MSKKNYTPRVSKEENITSIITMGAIYVAEVVCASWIVTKGMDYFARIIEACEGSKKKD